MRTTRRGALIALTIGVIVVVAASVTLIVHRSGVEYESAADQAVTHVHLGDSFAAGAGIGPLQEDSPFLCQRSARNFGAVLAQRHDHDYRDVSCSGAWTESLFRSQYEGVAPQLDALSADTDLVTLMIGGNDAGLYSMLVGDCARVAADDLHGAPCRAELGRRPERAIADEIAPDVTAALTAVAERAPRAQIIVVGYPWLVPRSRACRPAVQLADGDIAFVRDVQRHLNEALARAAGTVGARFVDLAEVSDRHDACRPADERWIEPMVGGTSPIVMHPNAAGQEAIADAVDASGET